MAIPANVAYPLPAADELPAGRLEWQLDPSRAALLIHDMQQYFIDFFKRGTSPVEQVVANTARLKEAAHRHGIPVFYTAQPGDMPTEDRGLLADVWGPGMTAREEHRRIIPELTPGPDDTVLSKWRYSAFVRSDLEERLRARRRDQLILCGVYAYVGVLVTASDAFTKDMQCFLIADATADFSEANHRLAISWAGDNCADIRTTDALLAQLAAYDSVPEQGLSSSV